MMDYDDLASTAEDLLQSAGTMVQIGGEDFPAVIEHPGQQIGYPEGYRQHGVLKADARVLTLPSQASTRRGDTVEIDGREWIVYEPMPVAPGGVDVIHQVGVARAYVDQDQLTEDVTIYEMERVEDERSHTWQRKSDPAYEGKAFVRLAGPDRTDHGGTQAVEWDAEVMVPAPDLRAASRLEVDWGDRVIESVATAWASDWSREWVNLYGKLKA